MPTSLEIRDQTVANVGKPEYSFIVTVVGETISVRELITERVRQEVALYNQQRPAFFRMLVQPSKAERTLNGFKLARSRTIDPDQQVQKALEAFESNGFIVLVGDRQAESLDESIPLHEDMTVTFLKLVPLVGG